MTTPVDHLTGDTEVGVCISCGHDTTNKEFVCQDCKPGALARAAVRDLTDEELVAERVGGRPPTETETETASHDAVTAASNREIAEHTGASESTVRRQRDAEIEERGLADDTDEPAIPALTRQQQLEYDLRDVRGVAQHLEEQLTAERDALKALQSSDPDGAIMAMRGEIDTLRTNVDHWMTEHGTLARRVTGFEARDKRVRAAADQCGTACPVHGALTR